jgi:hypothetical protein
LVKNECPFFGYRYFAALLAKQFAQPLDGGTNFTGHPIVGHNQKANYECDGNVGCL